MFALFLVALFALAAIAALGVLADSGLRWWSAFGQLRREIRHEGVYAALPALRSPVVSGGCTGLGRPSLRPFPVISVSRAA